MAEQVNAEQIDNTEENLLQLYLNVDGNGDIVEVYAGNKIIPTKVFSFYFLVVPEVLAEIESYKVEMVGFEAKLVKK